MSRSVLRNVFRLVILLCITTTVSASPHDADRTPGLSVERGEMRGFDKDSQAVVLRTATGDESFRLTSATILREGDHVIQPGDLWRFVGHSAKARVQRSKGQQVLTNMIISPEHVTHGRLVSYDPRSRGLVVDANEGRLSLTLTPGSRIAVEPALIDPDQLQRFVGHVVKITMSMADGHVISVWVRRKEN
jgi:hypothetical protein